MDEDFHACEVSHMIKVWVGGVILAALVGAAIYPFLF